MFYIDAPSALHHTVSHLVPLVPAGPEWPDMTPAPPRQRLLLKKAFIYVFLYNLCRVRYQGGGKWRDLFVFQPQRYFHQKSGGITEHKGGLSDGVGRLWSFQWKVLSSKKTRRISTKQEMCQHSFELALWLPRCHAPLPSRRAFPSYCQAASISATNLQIKNGG